MELSGSSVTEELPTWKHSAETFEEGTALQLKNAPIKRINSDHLIINKAV